MSFQHTPSKLCFLDTSHKSDQFIIPVASNVDLENSDREKTLAAVQRINLQHLQSVLINCLSWALLLFPYNI